MPERISRAVQLLAIKFRECFMREQVARCLGDGDAKFLLRCGELFRLHQRQTQQRRER